ncbi:MAG: release factor glutamine methyltransferase [Micromonosporaceae bacterium]|nr:release factor glutamine methyltransferase [Micromonosporaceae bacterium]
MTSVSAPDPRSALVTRLRAAGCVFAEEEADLLIAAATTPADLAAMVDRRATGLPLEHVLGWAEFCGLRIAVDPGVFVPRRRTEFLVHRAAALIRRARVPVPGAAPARPTTVVVDLCCGSGALGIALVAALSADAGAGVDPDATVDADGNAAVAADLCPVEVYAVDIDPAAVRCARRNVAALGGVRRAEVYLGDLYDPLPATLRGRVDLLLANAPYVPTDAVGLMPPEARIHEPLVALDGGADGLDVLRRVIAEAPSWLTPGGHLVFETSERQAPRITGALARTGLIARVFSSDEAGATVVVATRPTLQSGPAG